MTLTDVIIYFFFKPKTAYEMRISDWSSDVCSSDLLGQAVARHRPHDHAALEQLDIDARGIAHPDQHEIAETGHELEPQFAEGLRQQTGRTSCREREGQYV